MLVSESDRFEQLKEAAVKIVIEARSYAVASIDDLIRMKTEAGRPQDLFDIDELQKARDRIPRK